MKNDNNNSSDEEKIKNLPISATSPHKKKIKINCFCSILRNSIFFKTMILNRRKLNKFKNK